MLRRKPGAPRPVDPVDQELVEGVEAELPWHVLIKSASCPPDEAEQRLLRLWRTGFLEGMPGATRPSRTSLAPVRSVPPEVPASSSQSARSWPAVQSVRPAGPSVAPRPTGEALLRELRAARGGTSVPPPESIYRSVTPAAAVAPATRSSAPPGSQRFVVDSPLGLLIEELSRGQGIQRWSAGRLREALEEELSGNYVQAVAIIQVVLGQLDDPRIRTERTRLTERAQQVTSSVYRSRALDAERQSRHTDAAEQWRKVLEAQPNDAEAAMHAAKCLIDAGDLKQAAYYARRATQLAPENVTAHRLLLLFFKRSGMEASAQREREILLKLRKA